MFHTFFYEPLYNLLVVFLQIVPLHDIGISIILTTLVVKTLLLPINISATRSQYAIKKIEEEIKNIRDKHKDNPHESGKKMMEVYKREKINPLSSLFAIILQIPIFFALYFVFYKGISFDPESIYSFVKFPESLHIEAFGILDVTQKSLAIAILTGVSSYFLARRQTAQMVSNKTPAQESFQDHFMKSMRIQMLYVLPLIIGFSSYVLPAALGLYWTTSNILSYLQDIYIKHHISRK